ncbi:hypothetical protein VP01_3493g4 [Puccinia sorghi]|uniref:Uncharacterized protein n=1 Tax=Puccinia sorghi TaxID=27349 RepID=A0A0L6UWL3_9BASI|nr:hypothetical protein VP01_3493g4 [Puccinia sorghi]
MRTEEEPIGSSIKPIENLCPATSKSLQNVSPIKPYFHFQRASCSSSKWIKTISSLDSEFLGPTTNNKCIFPTSSIFLPFKSMLKKKNRRLPLTNTSQYQQKLHTLSQIWFNFCIDFTAHQQVQSPTGKKLLLLLSNSWLMTHISQHHPKALNLKNSSSNFVITANIPAPKQEFIKGAHSVDVIHNLQKFIIYILMGYIIIQTDALGPQRLTDAEKKTYRKTKSLDPLRLEVFEEGGKGGQNPPY